MSSRGLTLASRHIDHYLTGRGVDYPENVVDIVTRDQGIRGKLARAIRRRRRGHIRLRQGDYSVEDFRFAFGAIDRVDYQVDRRAGTVHIWFMDRYEWHPVGFGYSRKSGDSRRVTNCVHAAAVELKSSGAADYWMVGDAVVQLNLITGSSTPTSGETDSGENEL